jgi:exodeoxyribonuclease V beta subunit
MDAEAYTSFDIETAPLNTGTILLEASAGTGKTYTLTGILVRMLLEGVIEKIEQALVVTFTVAATQELKNRLRTAIQKAHDICRDGASDDEDPFYRSLARHKNDGVTTLRKALDEFDQASVMTIHGFCKRLLDESAFESEEPFELNFVADDGPLLQSAAADALRIARKNDSPAFGAVLEIAKIGPDELVALYRNWQRYPNVALDPPTPQVEQQLQSLTAAASHAASHWNEEILTQIAQFKWLSEKGPKTSDLKRYFQRALEDVAEQPAYCIETLTGLATSRLQADLRKAHTGQAIQKPFFTSCQDVLVELQSSLDHLRVELLQNMDARLKVLKQEHAVLTNDDLLDRTHEAITDPTRQQRLLLALRDRYKVGLIDEFQDTDDHQYAILSKSFEGRPLFLIGDPKQSIYAFRGADLRTYLGAVDDATQKNTLSINYRSSHQLVAAVNQLFGRSNAFVEPNILMHTVCANADQDQLQLSGSAGAAMRFRMLPLGKTGKGAPTHLNNEPAKALISEDVAKEIHSLLTGTTRIDGDRVLPRHIAVLTRSNKDARVIQTQLLQANVAAVIGKSGDVFDTDECVELERLLHAIQQPNNTMVARAALATRIWGVNAEQLAECDDQNFDIEQHIQQLEGFRHTWNTKGFIVMAGQLIESLDAEARLLMLPDGERRLTNTYQLIELLHQAEHQHRLTAQGLLQWLRHESTHKADTDHEHRALRLESDEDAVQILTMHGSKGLQYEIVFCPFLWQGGTADTNDVTLDPVSQSDSTHRRSFAFKIAKTDPRWLKAAADRLAEECRLTYVALTRAKRRCYVHYGAIGRDSYARSGLGWLLNPFPVDQNHADWPIAWSKAYADRKTQLADDLRDFAAQSGGAIQVEQMDSKLLDQIGNADRDNFRDKSSRPHAQARIVATPRKELPRRKPKQIHSFSSLVAQGDADTHAQETRDPPKPVTDLGQGIFGFSRGAKAGLCLHDVLEHVDFSKISTAATRDHTRNTLLQHGLLNPENHLGDLDPLEAVLQNLRDLAGARVQPDGPTMQAICSQRRLAEWKFTLPIKQPILATLAEQFSKSGCAMTANYANRLRNLPRQHFAGFLTGFADMITEYNGRYWIIDWKSNHLGNEIDDYGDDALQHAMQEHHYILQYHIYSAAWHKHLQTRLPNYDYEQHFGGVCYAFFRGAMTGRSSGMFYARPEKSLIEAIQRWTEDE